MERIEAYPRANWREKAMEQQAAKANNSSKATEHRNDAVNEAFTVPRAQPSAGFSSSPAGTSRAGRWRGHSCRGTAQASGHAHNPLPIRGRGRAFQQE